jgi:proline iminopeptidase
MWPFALAHRVRAIRWDQRGCGRSERRGPYSLARTVRDLEAVRRHYGFERVAVLGHSWGAQLALRYALDYPTRVSKLVYVSGTELGWDWHRQYKRNFAARLGSDQDRLTALKGRVRTDAEDREFAVLQWSADFADPTKAASFAEHMATPWFGINYECNGAMSAKEREDWREPELAAECRNLTVPTLIVDGAQDIRLRSAVNSLERALPSAVRVVLPSAGHVPWLEVPEQFHAALLKFLHPLSLEAGSGSYGEGAHGDYLT